MNILFFGNLKEQLGTGQLSLPITSVSDCTKSDRPETNSEIITVASVRHYLQQSRSDWSQALADNNLLFAVNQTMADETTTLSDADEVAFFPPVTGG